MLKRIVNTADDRALLIARLALGLVIFPHGAQKLLGWFGGAGLADTISYFADALGIPAPITLLVVVIEFFGALALIVGALSRLAALGVAAVMVGAVLTVHVSNGFFMNWAGAQAGEGFEYHLLALALAAAVMLKGGGALSVDRKLATPQGQVSAG